MQAIEIVANFGDLCGECPRWDDSSASLYWTDITGRRFFRLPWTERRPEMLSHGLEIASFAFLRSGGFLVANSSGIWLWTDIKSSPKLLVGAVDGHRCALNDCAADPRGRLFTGSTFYDPSGSEYEQGCLFRLDPDGSAHVVDDGFLLSNGIAFSPEETTMYHADSAARKTFAYDYRADSGAISNRRTLINVSRDEGIPDGLCVDAEGFLWCAFWFGGCVARYDPDGKLERRITLPAAQVSSLTFGGPDLTDMFVTTAGAPDALPLAPPGYNSDAATSGGALYHLIPGVAGKKEYRAALDRAANDRN
jgi:sugar lactone lactonase YvrE